MIRGEYICKYDKKEREREREIVKEKKWGFKVKGTLIKEAES